MERLHERAFGNAMVLLHNRGDRQEILRQLQRARGALNDVRELTRPRAWTATRILLGGTLSRYGSMLMRSCKKSALRASSGAHRSPIPGSRSGHALRTRLQLLAWRELSRY